MATESSRAPAPTVHIAKLSGGKPDQKHHNEEMDRLKAEIDQTHAKIASVRAALSGEATAETPSGRRRAELRKELEQLRSEQASRKGSRGKVFDELKAVQDEIAAKVKALHGAQNKAPFKSTAELDAHIKDIEAQIESGSMKIVEERKALNEVSLLKKSRKSMDSLSGQQAQIDQLRARADKLRSSLDDPETVAANQRYDAIKRELDTITQEQEKTVGSRSKLLSQRTTLSKRLDELYQARRDRLSAYHAENDKYYSRVRAEREHRQEVARKERLEAEKERIIREETEMREEAAMPAFAQEIEDCDQLIRLFSGESAGETHDASASNASSKPGLPSLPEVPRPDATVPEGAVVARKKGEEEEYFVAGGKKKKGGKKNKQPEADENGALHVPLGMLTALMNLSIPPPANAADRARVVENIKLKREYFLSNQARVTEENKKKVEERIAEMKAKHNLE